MAARRNPPSSIDLLEPELKKLCHELLKDGVGYEEIAARLRALGAETSKSSIGRYNKRLVALTERTKLAREMSNAFAQDLQNTNGDIGRLLTETLQAALLEIMMQLEEGDVDEKKVATLARALKDLELAKKLNVETEMKIRAQALDEAAAEVETVAVAEGLTGDTVNAIKAKILGLKS